MNMREVFSSQITAAWENKELTDVEYKQLIAEQRAEDENGDDFDLRMFQKLEAIHADKLFARILKGAEYIDSIGKDHPNYAKAMQRYDDLSARMERYNKQKDPDIGVITRWDIYNRLRTTYLDSVRKMDEEELMNLFPLVSLETIRNGMAEFDFALRDALAHAEHGYPHTKYEEETQ